MKLDGAAEAGKAVVAAAIATVIALSFTLAVGAWWHGWAL